MEKVFLSREYLYAAAAAQAGLPSQYLDPRRAHCLVDEAVAHIQTRLVGQREALHQLRQLLMARLFERNLSWSVALASLPSDRDSRPLACVLALGPTGVGKTETARLLAEKLYSGKMITLNGSEVGLEAPHGVATWVGAPPGYVGSNQGGLLTDGLRSHKACVILVDEIEKAAPEAIQNVLLPMMGEGTVTDRNNGEALSTAECVVFATSNIAVEPAAFDPGEAATTRHDGDANVFRWLVRYLRPEIIGRFNKVLTYRGMTLQEKWIVWELQMDSLCGHRARPLEMDTDARAWLEAELGSIRTGARGVIDLFRTSVMPIAALDHRGTHLTRSGDGLAIRG